jgi:hypothetical protein
MNVYISAVSSSERKRKEQGRPKTNSRGRQIDNANLKLEHSSKKKNLKLEQERLHFSIGLEYSNWWR